MGVRPFRFATEPHISAIPFHARSRGRAAPLLTADDKAALMAAGTLERLPKGATLYAASAPADHVFNLIEGVAKTYQILPDSTTHVSGFLFAGDMFGQAEQGRYVESAAAIVPITAYKIRFSAFDALMRQNGPLAVRMLCKAADELRRKHRHALILARQDAAGKIAMFLRALENAALPRGPGGTTYFPMTRSETAGYVGLTLEAVSRAIHALDNHGVVKFVDLHHFHVLDNPRLDALIAGAAEAPAIGAKPAHARNLKPERIRAGAKGRSK